MASVEKRQLVIDARIHGYLMAEESFGDDVLSFFSVGVVVIVDHAFGWCGVEEFAEDDFAHGREWWDDFLRGWEDWEVAFEVSLVYGTKGDGIEHDDEVWDIAILVIG